MAGNGSRPVVNVLKEQSGHSLVGVYPSEVMAIGSRRTIRARTGAAIRSASWRQCPLLAPLPMKDFPDVVPIVVDVAPIVVEFGPIVVDVAPIVPDVAPIVMTVLPAETETGVMEPVVTDPMEPVVGVRGADVPSVVIVTEVTAPARMLSVGPDVEPPSVTAFDSSCMCRAAA
jgi:hypothetical protein